MIDAVVFDLGNTLFDYRDYRLPAYAVRLQTAMDRILALWHDTGNLPLLDDDGLSRQVFEEMLAIEHDARERLVEFDASTELRLALARRLPGMDDTWDASINEIVYGIMRELYEPAPGALSALRGLKGMGLKTGLISNTQFRTANHLEDLEQMGMLKWLDTLEFSIDGGVRKPAPEPFLAVLDRLGVQPQHAMMVGDSIEADIGGARNLGMVSALIHTPENAAAIQRGDHGADHVIGGVGEVVGIVACENGWSR